MRRVSQVRAVRALIPHSFARVGTRLSWLADQIMRARLGQPCEMGAFRSRPRSSVEGHLAPPC
jgi:hypothetical protein